MPIHYACGRRSIGIILIVAGVQSRRNGPPNEAMRKIREECRPLQDAVTTISTRDASGALPGRVTSRLRSV